MPSRAWSTKSRFASRSGHGRAALGMPSARATAPNVVAPPFGRVCAAVQDDPVAQRSGQLELVGGYGFPGHVWMPAGRGVIQVVMHQPMLRKREVRHLDSVAGISTSGAGGLLNPDRQHSRFWLEAHRLAEQAPFAGDDPVVRRSWPAASRSEPISSPSPSFSKTHPVQSRGQSTTDQFGDLLVCSGQPPVSRRVPWHVVAGEEFA